MPGMKILVLGAGAIGGYFGSRLVQAGADLSFLVRERRAAQLRAQGLVVRSPHGDFQVPVRTVLQAELLSPYDLVLLACKAYDLAPAMEAIRPAMGPGSFVLPLLNGVAHIETLQSCFGAARVVAGSAAIPASLSPAGEVLHLSALHRIVFGMLPQSGPQGLGRLEELRRLFGTTPVEAVLAADIWLELWEKFSGLATLAAMTCLMRAAVGDILESEDGAFFLDQTFAACVRVAEAAGHPPREAAKSRFRELLHARGSILMASMLRDVESLHAAEGAHIVGDMLQRARAAGVEPGALRHAWCHLQSYEARRAREAGKA